MTTSTRPLVITICVVNASPTKGARIKAICRFGSVTIPHPLEAPSWEAICRIASEALLTSHDALVDWKFVAMGELPTQLPTTVMIYHRTR